ncbi:uncharacterized protein LOC111635088 [Centruroides sculpturatus]|uniref:uncharacterized protein LOC111635088 n=1 Tax=Centruroides sculpturatus TaxID=218467 RepID=UPI000C6D0B4F|nr:uncharacterized protein LOC111635088 [Centruroides sculpturatus]
MDGGKKCEGADLQFGNCNTKICPDEIYTLPPDIEKHVKEKLKSMYRNTVITAGKPAVLNCVNNNIKSIMNVYPRGVLTWTKDELPLSLDRDRTKVYKAKISINPTIDEDSGVYVCRLLFAPNSYRVMAVNVLTVINGSHFISIKEEDKLYLPCNYLSLVKIYGNLTQIWLLNDLKFFSRNVSIKENDKLVPVVENVKLKHGGKWTCLIKTKKIYHAWIVNIIVVKGMIFIYIKHRQPKVLKFCLEIFRF